MAEVEKNIKFKIFVFIFFIIIPVSKSYSFSEDFQKKWMDSLPYHEILLNDFFWQVSAFDFRTTHFFPDWVIISERGLNPVFSPNLKKMPIFWGIKPFKFEIHFNGVSQTPAIIRINLWNKGDASLIKKGPADSFKILGEFIEDCKQEKINVKNEKEKISSKINKQGYEIQLNNSIWFILSEKNEYLTLEIREFKKDERNFVQKHIMETQGVDQEKQKNEFHQKLIHNVVKRANGDILIYGIPMIDQGKKGYCAPATCARVMQYYGYEVDEHQLAKAMDTRSGGGTSLASIKATLKKLSCGLPIFAKDVKFSSSAIENYISQGIPIIWTIPGHERLIIGINMKKKYIIYSDTWGRQGVESSMEFDKAKKISLYLIVLR